MLWVEGLEGSASQTATAPLLLKVEVVAAKVLFLSHSLNFGGVESHLNSTAAGVRESHWEAMYCALTSGGSVGDNLAKSGHSVFLLGAKARIPSILTILRLVRLLKTLSPDVIHCFGIESNFHGIIAGRFARIPLIFAEEIGTPSHSLRARFVMKVLYSLASTVIVPTENVKKRLLELGEAPKEKIQVLPNPVDAHGSVPLPPKGKPLKLLFVGRLEAEKNPLSLVKAVSAPHKSGREVELEMYGDGSQLGEIVREIESSGLEKVVTLHGHVDAPFSVCGAAHLFVQPSRTEGFGIALVEAMLAGIPVLTTTAGVAGDLILHGWNGWLLPSASESSIAEGIVQATTANHSEMRRIGSRGESSVLGIFSPSEYIEKLLLLYEKSTTAN